MKRYIFVSLLVFSLLLATNAQADFFDPWQMLAKSATGSTVARVTLEANANQNIIIDRITVTTDKSLAYLTISEYDRGTASFECGWVSPGTWYPLLGATKVPGYPLAVVRMRLSSQEAYGAAQATQVGTQVPMTQVLGNGDSLTPFWVADLGKAVTISIEGTSLVDFVVNARRGKVYPENPSKAVGY